MGSWLQLTRPELAIPHPFCVFANQKRFLHLTLQEPIENAEKSSAHHQPAAENAAKCNFIILFSFVDILRFGIPKRLHLLLKTFWLASTRIDQSLQSLRCFNQIVGHLDPRIHFANQLKHPHLEFIFTPWLRMRYIEKFLFGVEEKISSVLQCLQSVLRRCHFYTFDRRIFDFSKLREKLSTDFHSLSSLYRENIKFLHKFKFFCGLTCQIPITMEVKLGRKSPV